MLAVLAVACGSGASTTGSGPTGGTVFDPSVPLTFPGGADRLVLRASGGLGGLMPYEYSLMAVPGLSIYGDGSAVLAGGHGVRAVTDVVSLERTSVNLTGLAGMVRAADRAGLFLPGLSLDQPNVTDLPTTEVELFTADGHHRHVSAYALDFTEHEGQLPAASQRGRAALQRFLQEVKGLTRSTQRHPYQPERYALLTDRFTSDDAKPASGVPAPWPVGDLSAARPLEPTGERCLVVDGADALRLGRLLAAGEVRNTQVWTAGLGGALVRVVIRPLLPDQRTCER